MALRRYGLARRRKAVGFSQESFAERVGVDRSTVVRWEAGESEPLPYLRPKMAKTLQVTVDQLAELIYVTKSADVEPDAAVLPYQGEVDDANRRNMLKALSIGAASMTPLVNVKDVVLEAARSSARLRASVEIPGISQYALTDMRQRLYQLATDYALTSDLHPILRELIALRNDLYEKVMRRQHHPGDTRDLYVLLSAACILLASVSHDLSEPRAGMTQATTAGTFAELSGHLELLTWVHCTKAMIASWWASPEQVLLHAQKARAAGAVGISAARLAGLQARALAQLGKRTEAITILNAARDRRDALGDGGDLRELGEVFSFPLPRQHYYNAATHLNLGNWKQVERETGIVAEMYGTPAIGQSWPVTLTLSRIYQAQARLHQHGPDGAFDVLQPVFDIPVRLRLPQTSQALTGLSSSLRARPFARLQAARDLTDAIESFQSSIVAR